jgi:protein-tyrosine-phosphatase/tRNA A37 threonylcarbamoyladenosine synthetase subunit TsaC/SUA5/YrdC
MAMHNLLDWKNSDDTRDIVHIVVQTLVEGRKVALPADTAYHVVASGLAEGSAAHLSELSEEGRLGRCVLFLRSAQELRDYVPDLSTVAARIARRGWPGPLILDLPVDRQHGLIDKLPAEIQRLVLSEGRVAFRVVSHPAIQHALRLMAGPIVAAPVCLEGKPVQSANHAGQWSRVAIVVDDGPTQWNGYSTILQVDGNVCRVAQPGVLAGEALYRTAQFVVLFVCTGNTCRSPMAEALMREKLSKRFQKSKFPIDPVFVASAGISAFPGGPASPEAQKVIAARGLDLSGHQSCAVTEHSLNHADLILTMTHSHRESILDRMPQIRGKVHPLSRGRTDVSDPFGGSEATYQACASQIDSLLDQWIQELDDSWFPQWVLDTKVK